MSKIFNLHTHTHYCDGSSKPEDYVIKALELGFHSLGFSGHAPVSFPNKFAIKQSQLNDYVEEIRSLQDKYRSAIELYLSLEIDFIPGISDDFLKFKQDCKLDYIIGSIHLVKGEGNSDLWFIDGGKQDVYDQGLERVFGGDIRKGVRAYYHQINQMLSTQNFDILGHFDKIKMHNKDRYFTEDESWYIELLDECLDLIKSKDVIVEVNTRGLYKKRSSSLFPGIEILKKIKERKIPITLSSDAHKPEELGLLLKETTNTLIQLGFRELMCFGVDGWEAVSIG
jgi:histidinol-phosphatase (PHP family)